MNFSLFPLIFFAIAMSLVNCDHYNDIMDVYNKDSQPENNSVIVWFCFKEVDLQILPGGDQVDPNHKIKTKWEICDPYHKSVYTGNWTLLQVSSGVGEVTQLTNFQSPEWICLPQ
jgi:hypothetical protein